MADRSRARGAAAPGFLQRIISTVAVAAVAFSLMPSLAVAAKTPTVLDAAVPIPVGEPPRCDFNGDGFEDLAIRLPGYDVAEARDAGAVDVLYGSPQGLGAADGRRITQTSTGHGVSESGDRFGFSTACGDMNGDGFSDLVVGSPGENVGKGRIDVIEGSPRGLRPRRSVALANPEGPAGALFGWAVATIRVGEPVGAVHVLVGAPGTGGGDGAVYTLDAAAPTTWIRSDNPTAARGFGSSVGAGDVNGDGVHDLVAGAPQGGVGAVAVMLGQAAGGVAPQAAVYAPDPWPGGRRYGDVVQVFDLDRDGRAELVVGDPRYDSAAGMLEVLGYSGGFLAARSQSDAAAFDVSSTDSASLGSAIALGDFDDDRVVDVALGLPTRDWRDKRDAGQVGIFYAAGANPETATAEMLDQAAPGVQDRPDSFDLFGSGLTAGDFNGDGFTDLAVYVPGDPSAKALAGLVHVLEGGPSGISHVGDATFTTNAVGRAQRKAFFPWTVDPALGGRPAGPAISVDHYTIDPEGEPEDLDAPYAQLVSLIDLADPGSEILVALYRMRNDNPLVAGLLDGLGQAAAQRAVDVRFVVDGSLDPAMVDELLGRGFPVTVCDTNCVAGDNGAQHSKFVLFSSTEGVPAVVSSTANWTLAGLSSSFESMAIIREFDPATSLIFDAHRERFIDFEEGRIEEADAGTVVNNGDVRAAFLPWLQGDPVVDALGEVELTAEPGGALSCNGATGRSVIRLAAARADGQRLELAERLAELHDSGCKVQVFANEGALPLVQQLENAGFVVYEQPHRKRSGVWCVSGQHSKQLVILDRSAAKAERIAWLGSHNLEMGNLRNSADTWLRFDSGPSFRAGSRHMNSMFDYVEPCDEFASVGG